MTGIDGEIGGKTFDITAMADETPLVLFLQDTNAVGIKGLVEFQSCFLLLIPSRKGIAEQNDAGKNEFSTAKDAGATTVSDPELERAYNLITSPEAKAAFTLSEEPQEVRQRYGTDGVNGIGQSCLLARRLVERGVPFVTVNHTGWDTHQDIFTLKERYPMDRNAHLPSLDRALSALIQDLTDRRMLDETLVVVMGEFGRTPKINSQGGRDH